MKTDLINGKPLKSIILFALPIMASSMLHIIIIWWIILLSADL